MGAVVSQKKRKISPDEILSIQSAFNVKPSAEAFPPFTLNEEKADVTILIAGGGICGLSALNMLISRKTSTKTSMKFIVVDPKEYFCIKAGLLWIGLRGCFEKNFDQFGPVTFGKYADIFKSYPNVQFVQGKVTRVGPKSAYVGGVSVSFDYCILATGMTSPSCFSKDIPTIHGELNHLRDINDSLSKHNKFVIIGGGAVGVTQACELKWRFPEKHIVLIHSRSRLLTRQPKRVHNEILHRFRKLKIECILGTRVYGFHEDEIHLRELESLKETSIDISDAKLFWAGEHQPNTTYMAGEMTKAINAKGFVNPNSFLYLPDFPQIYVGGTCSGVDPDKSVSSALIDGICIANNILCAIEGRKFEKIRLSAFCRSHAVESTFCLGPNLGLLSVARKRYQSKNHLVLKYLQTKFVHHMLTHPEEMGALWSAIDGDTIKLPVIDERMNAFSTKNYNSMVTTNYLYMQLQNNSRLRHLQQNLLMTSGEIEQI